MAHDTHKPFALSLSKGVFRVHVLRQAQHERGFMEIKSLPFGAIACPLQPHPSQSGPEIQLLVELDRIGDRTLRLWYVISGDIARIALPPFGDPTRANELWKHSCCELFVRAGEVDSYFEFNFASSRAWNAYRFDGYRRGMTEAEVVPPEVRTAGVGNIISVGADITLPEEMSGNVLIALSAVIEETDGTKSYWALRHPPGPPDFHHPDCFALELPALEPS